MLSLAIFQENDKPSRNIVKEVVNFIFSTILTFILVLLCDAGWNITFIILIES